MCLTLLTSCSEGDRDISSVVASELIREARIIMEQVGVQNFKYISINESEHPSIYRISPLKVYVRENGLYLRTKDGFVKESGYFVPAQNINTSLLLEDGDPSFKKLYSDFYEYKYGGCQHLANKIVRSATERSSIAVYQNQNANKKLPSPPRGGSSHHLSYA